MEDLDDNEKVKADERYRAFTEIVKLTQTYDSGTFGDMVPILESKKPGALVEGLKPITKYVKSKQIKDAKLPEFFLLHGRSKAVVRCPYQWTEDWAPNAEFVLLWAIEEALNLDI